MNIVGFLAFTATSTAGAVFIIQKMFLVASLLIAVSWVIDSLIERKLC